jgi:pimeloyl-ACP methyl ester carboxylesterase
MILHATSRGDGPVLVLLHGLFGQSGNFGAVQRRLAAAGRRVVALDLRNHGASPHAPGMDYRTLAADVHETLGSMGLLPCAVLGHSMGGKAAMALALQHPEAVARLCVADIAPVRYRPHLVTYASAMRDINLFPGMTRSDADAALAPTVADAGERAFLLSNLLLAKEPRWRIGLEEIIAGMDDIQDWPVIPAPPFAGPTLFLTGARSRYVQPEHRPAVAALFPAARFVTLKNAGHWLHADDPEGFLAVVEAFAPATPRG